MIMAPKSLTKPDPFEKYLGEKHPGVQRRVPVLLPLPFPGPLDYTVPPSYDSDRPASDPFVPGQLVAVPLGRRDVIGCVWNTHTSVPADFAPPPLPVIPHQRLKAILRRIDAPPLPEELLHFVDWVAAYTLTPPGLLLSVALRLHAQAPTKPVPGWGRTGTAVESVRLTPARRAVLSVLSDEPMTTADLVQKSGTSAAVLRGLASAGLLRQTVIKPCVSYVLPNPDYAPPLLSEEQAGAAQALRDAVLQGGFGVSVLEGVTGSGKTEVYFEAMAACLTQGKQVLVLLPEIALSTQWTDRFAGRFGVPPALWHSCLGQKRRRETWSAIADGTAKVVVGARSALFLPFQTLGLVVVDEEHESTFKQEDGTAYHGRDMAIVRARIAQAPAILVSATPSLETRSNVDSGRYRHLQLTARHGGARLPNVSLIDLRTYPPERGFFLSSVLVQAIEAKRAAGEQAMLFLNRRGYAPLTLCRSCGHRMQCPNCTAWLVEHRAQNRLRCHHCGHDEPIPSHCPSCAQDDTLVPIGPGVERVVEEARFRFPDARILVMSSDTLKTPADTAEAIRQITDGAVDLVIGTQIVAKGWHFPNMTLVGVVDADLGLGGGDLRAAERTVQLMHQVAGRAGRAERPGNVLLQSYVTDHPVMKALASNDFEAFMAQEAAQRRPGFWPPYGRLAALIVSADKAEDADALAREIAVQAPEQEGVQVLGPAPAPLAVLRGRHRRRLLLRTVRGLAVQPILRAWLAPIRPKGSARVDVDIDPFSFL